MVLGYRKAVESGVEIANYRTTRSDKPRRVGSRHQLDDVNRALLAVMAAVFDVAAKRVSVLEAESSIKQDLRTGGSGKKDLEVKELSMTRENPIGRPQGGLQR
jgi:hypothetical protein